MKNFIDIMLEISLHSLQKIIKHKQTLNGIIQGTYWKMIRQHTHNDKFNRTTKVETFDANTQVNRYDAEGLCY